MAARKLIGKTQPRLFTPPLRQLARRTSLGYSIADFADRGRSLPGACEMALLLPEPPRAKIRILA